LANKIQLFPSKDQEVDRGRSCHFHSQ